MAGLAYLLLPVTGLFAVLVAGSARARWHGFQAIAIGFLWPAVLYLSVLGPATLTRVVFAGGALVWLLFLVMTLIGRDPKLPVVGGYLKRAARVTDAPRSTSGKTSPTRR